MFIQFSPTALILISPVIPLMSFITKEKITFLVWDPIQNHTLHLVSMSLSLFSSGTVLRPCLLGHFIFYYKSFILWNDPESGLSDASSPLDLGHAFFGGHTTGGKV